MYVCVWYVRMLCVLACFCASFQKQKSSQPASLKNTYSWQHLCNCGDAGLEIGIIYRLQAAIPPPSTFSVFWSVFLSRRRLFCAQRSRGAAGAALRAALAFFRGYEEQVLFQGGAVNCGSSADRPPKMP